MAIVDELKQRFRAGSILVRIIYINVAIFLALRIAALLALFFNVTALEVVQWVEVPSGELLLRRPWTLFTYMFSHYDLLHILFNMLWLYWLGRIFMEYFTAKQLGALYVLGGLMGAALFWVAYAVLPYFDGKMGLLIGASASVMAIVVAVAVYVPHYQINLLFLGAVSLKWVAIITVVIDLLSVGDGNLGGQVAHLGGALMGVLFGLLMSKGHDCTAWLNRSIDALVSLFSSKRGPKMPRQPKQQKQAAPRSQETRKTATSVPDEDEIDKILDKLKQSGYGALSDEEKERLFMASRKR